MNVLAALTKHVLNYGGAENSLATTGYSVEPEKRVRICFPIEILLASKKPRSGLCMTFLIGIIQVYRRVWWREPLVNFLAIVD